MPFFQIYRLYIVYGRNLKVVAFPMVMELGFCGESLHLLQAREYEPKYLCSLLLSVQWRYHLAAC